MCFRQVPAFNTWATAKFFLKRRDGAIPRVFLALGGGPGKGSPKAGTTEISSPEPEVDRVHHDLRHAMSSREGQQLTSQMMWGREV